MKTDAALLDSVRRMDGNALTEIFDEYAPALFKYVMRMCNDPLEADQVVGDVFAKLLEQLSKGNGPRDNLRSYLFQAAYHFLVNHIRYTRRRTPLETFDIMPAEGYSIPIKLEKHIMYEAVSRAIQNELTEYQRQVIILRFLEGCSLQETAEILGKSVNIIKAVQNRAILNLRSSLHQWAMA